MSEFILIDGLGIIRKDDIREITPSFEEEFFISVVPPQRSNEEFKFVVSKEVTISLEIVRIQGSLKKKKGDEEEGVIDPNYVRVIKDSQELSYDDIVAKLFNNEVELLGKLPASVKNYKVRLGKQEEYMEKVATIQSEPNSPDYANLLLAAQKSAPTGEDMEKQVASLKRITDSVTERFFEMVEASDPEDDTEEEIEENAILSYFESEEMQELTDKAATSMLRSFYNKNMVKSFYVENDVEAESPVYEKDTNNLEQFFENNSLKDSVNVEADVNRAMDILRSEDTIRNVVDEDEEDEVTEADRVSASS